MLATGTRWQPLNNVFHAALLGFFVHLPASDMPIASHPYLLSVQCLWQISSHPDVAALRAPCAGDQRPDLAEQYLKLSTAFVRHGMPLQPSSLSVACLGQAVAVAVSCAACCHKKVATSALSLLSTVLAGATLSGGGAKQAALVASTQQYGEAIVRGAICSLLSPSPLPRVHKVASILLDLATLSQHITEINVAGAQRCGTKGELCSSSVAKRRSGDLDQVRSAGGLSVGNSGELGGTTSNMSDADSPGTWRHSAATRASQRQTGVAHSRHSPQCLTLDAATGEGSVQYVQDHTQSLLTTWLSAAVSSLPSSLISPVEADALLTDWCSILTPPQAARSSEQGSSSSKCTASRSYLLSRRFKRHVRDFAERHTKPSQDATAI